MKHLANCLSSESPQYMASVTVIDTVMMISPLLKQNMLSTH